MNTSPVEFGIVGTGMIAAVVAEAIRQAANARLVAVSGRKIDTAQKFVSTRPGVASVEGFAALLARPDVDAVYVATPTAAKEEIALAAIADGKHVLVDKPFMDRHSVQRMTEAAAAKGVVFMDATHFVHHPRTAGIQAATAERIGSPRSLHTAFYFPFSDLTNIRFDTRLEPTGAIGDMAWYSMRAVVEYLRPEGKVVKATAAVERNAETHAVVRVSGLIAFASGEVSTFDAGYTAGTVLMDLQLLGTTGVIGMDDFVLDAHNSFAFKNPDLPIGYTFRTGVGTRQDVTFVLTPSETSAEVAMIQDFADLMTSGDTSNRAAYADATLKTQEYLDALWASVEP